VENHRACGHNRTNAEKSFHRSPSLDSLAPTRLEGGANGKPGIVSGDLIILDGSAFFYSDENGDVEAKGPTGFFFEDVRHLSTWNLTIDGEPIEPLTSRRVDYYSARVVGRPEGDE